MRLWNDREEAGKRGREERRNTPSVTYGNGDLDVFIWPADISAE